MRLRAIDKLNRNKIKNISKNNDLSMNLFLAREIRKITESYPTEIKTVKKQINCTQISVHSISPAIANEFKTIAHNKGLTTSQLLTLHLPDIISYYPDWMVRFEE